MSVDRLIRSVPCTWETLELAELCPRLAVVDRTDGVDARGAWWSLVRIHAAVDARDGRPLRSSDGPEARIFSVAAGAGPVAVTAAGVEGVLLATPDRPALSFRMGWDEIDDVGPAPSGGVRLLSTRLLGGLTIDVIGPVPAPALRGGARTAGARTPE